MNEHKSLNRKAYRRSPAPHLLNSTLEVKNARPILHKRVVRDCVKAGVSLKVGQEVFLVESDSVKDRYYVVTWDHERSAWRCSCGAGCQSHTHTRYVTRWIASHIVARRPVQESPLKATVAEAVQVCIQAQRAQNDFPRPKTAQEWKEAGLRQKAADRQYYHAYHEQARAVAAACRKFA